MLPLCSPVCTRNELTIAHTRVERGVDWWISVACSKLDLMARVKDDGN